jgi:hypothetical protein
MARSKDPQGQLPAPGADGSLTLTVSAAHRAATIRAGLGIIVLGGAGALFLWWQAAGTAVIGLPLQLEALAAGAIALLALAPLLTPDLLFPPRLTIDARGIGATRRGRTITIGWDELRAITLKTVPAGRGGRTQTVTMLSGPGATRITFLPIYGVAPRLLATYISDLQAAVRGTPPLPVLSVASPGLRAVTSLRRLTRTLRWVLLAIVALVAVALVIAYFAAQQLANGLAQL